MYFHFLNKYLGVEKLEHMEIYPSQTIINYQTIFYQVNHFSVQLVIYDCPHRPACSTVCDFVSFCCLSFE